MAWTLELFRTVDGLRLMELPTVPFSWSRSVREGNMDGPPDDLADEAGTGIKFGLDALSTVIDFSLANYQDEIISAFMPTKHGIMALWEGTPIIGGPIAPNVNISRKGVSLSVDSYFDFLKKRYVVSENSFAADVQLAETSQQLYSIARRMIEIAMNKRSGALPIVLPEWRYGGHRRVWQGFNVANLSVAKLLEEIGNVAGGPDIDLRPRISSSGTRFEWVFKSGNDADPYIGQKVTHDWEELTTDATSLETTLSTAYINHRTYAVGDGEDVGTYVGRYDSEVPLEWPLIEKVVSDSSITKANDKDGSRLRSLGEGHLNPYPVIGTSLTVRADGTTPLGTFWPGEIARVTTRGNPALPDATYDLRILSMSGSSKNNSVQLEFDPMVLEKL